MSKTDYSQHPAVKFLSLAITILVLWVIAAGLILVLIYLVLAILSPFHLMIA